MSREGVLIFSTYHVGCGGMGCCFIIICGIRDLELYTYLITVEKMEPLLNITILIFEGPVLCDCKFVPYHGFQFSRQTPKILRSFEDP